MKKLIFAVYILVVGFCTSANVAPVPESANMLLLGTGLVGLAGYGRRKI